MRKAVTLAVALLAATSTGSSAQSYCCSHAGKVGYVQVSGRGSGVANWSKPDSSNFPVCTSSAHVMWIEDDTTIVSSDAARSMLATLLAAKAMDKPVTVYYAVDTSGVCRMRHLGIN